METALALSEYGLEVAGSLPTSITLSELGIEVAGNLPTAIALAELGIEVAGSLPTSIALTELGIEIAGYRNFIPNDYNDNFDGGALLSSEGVPFTTTSFSGGSVMDSESMHRTTMNNNGIGGTLASGLGETNDGIAGDGVVLGSKTTEIIKPTGGVTIASRTKATDSEITKIELVLGSETTEFHLSEFRTFDGGLVVDGESVEEYFHPADFCTIVESINFCGCVDPEESEGGLVIGGSSWFAANKYGDGLFAYYPLGEHDTDDIARGRDAIANGELDLTKGILCETAEQFRQQRYYEIPNFNYWQGFTATWWFKSAPVIFESTLLSFDPSLRVGLTWLGETVIQARWFDETDVEAYGQPIEHNKWLHFALRFAPNEDLTLFIDGETSIVIRDARDFFDVASATFIGSLQGGSFISGDMQDFRIYDQAKSNEFIEAERLSYCRPFIATVLA